RGPVVRMIDDDSESNWPVPDVHTKLMSSVLLDVATDHQVLYSLVQSTLDALAELANARRQLISAPEQTDIGEQNFLDGLAGYGLKRCEEARTALDKLYLHCTGKELTQHRLR
ncbi:hypothetical protein ACQUZK_09065, partial [Streptococcus pyogenes]|uniref:hypothetical protein n=1 Tax=Streptococcus pyogenes TaxID=1314 RepID=UPI003DA0BEB2